jgi:hypothetical protein
MIAVNTPVGDFSVGPGGETVPHLEKISLENLHAPSMCRPVFPKTWMTLIKEIQESLAEVEGGTLSDWVRGFRCDKDATREIELWLSIARTYKYFSEGLSLDGRQSLYRFLIAMTVQEPGKMPELIADVLSRVGRKKISYVLRRFCQERRIVNRQVMRNGYGEILGW